MSDQQLADALHGKFYSDMPKAEFEEKIGLKPQAAPAPAGDFGDVVSAGFTSGVNAIPFVGPNIMDGLNSLKAAVHGVPVDVIAAENAQLEEAHPIAAGVGSVAGPTLAMAPLGLTGLGARALGLTGSIPARIGAGAASGGLIAGGDTAVRGGSPQETLTNTALGAGIGGALPIVGAGLRKGLQAITGTGVSPSARNVGRALSDDGIAPADVNARINELGPDAMLMDMGPNLQRQAGAVASVPGPGQKAVREAVTTRTKGAPARVEADVAATVGTGPELSVLREQTIAAQKAAAGPLYDKVRDVKVNMLKGNFAFVFNTPMGKQALAQARQMAANDGYRGVDTIQIIDYAKQALDDIAGEAIRKNKGNLARQASNLARTLAAEADKAAPDYKLAREAFAGPAKVIEAMDNGSSVFAKDMSPGQLKSTLSGMTASEKDAFIQAARSSIESQMGNAVNEALALRNLFKKGYNEAKLRILLGDKLADDLLKRINREATFGQTANVVTGNSETAARQAAQAEVAPDMARTWRPDSLFGTVIAAFDKARAGLQGTRQPKINSQMAGMQTQRTFSPQQIQQLERAVRPLPRSILPPALPAIVGASEERRKPIEITIRGPGGGR
jgi:hypothetical protein